MLWRGGGKGGARGGGDLSQSSQLKRVGIRNQIVPNKKSHKRGAGGGGGGGGGGGSHFSQMRRATSGEDEPKSGLRVLAPAGH